MKFTQEELLETLRAKLTKKVEKLSISERTLQSQAETLFAFASEDDELEAFSDKVLPSLVSLDGNYRKDNKDFTTQWEASHKAQPTPQTGRDEPRDSRLDELEKTLNELRAEREAEKRARRLAETRKTLSERFREKGISDSEWVSSYISKLALGDETDVEKETDDALRLFNKSNSQTPRNIVPGSTGKGAEQTENEFADVAKALRRERGNE